MKEDLIVENLIEIKTELAIVKTDAKATRAMIVDNGLAKAVEANASDLNTLATDFARFVDTRAATCPINRRKDDRQRRRFDQRTVLVSLGISLFVGIPAWILIIQGLTK